MQVCRKIASGIAQLRSIQRERDKAKNRSSGWVEVRDAHLEKFPECAACGGTSALQVHHVVPYAMAPDLELDPTNLITLCMGEFDCHLRLGHGGSFQHHNPRVVSDAKDFNSGTIGQRLYVLSEARENRRRI